jgi:hypothetical protein
MNESGAGRHSAYVIVGLLFCAAIVAQAAPGEVHLIDPGTWTKQPVSPAAMSKRMEMTALEYREYAPIPRVGHRDGFTLFKFSGDEGDDLDFLPVRKPKASGPSVSALTDFVRREFPGFVGR